MTKQDQSPVITPEVRHRVSGNYRGADAGSWEINAWLDAGRMASALARSLADKANELVRVVTETRLPSGRWGRRTVTVHPVAA